MKALVLFGPYPMSVDQLKAWAINEAGKLTVHECAKALMVLNHSRVVIRK